MKRILLYILVASLMMIAWTGVIFFGTVDGWFHQPISKQNTSQSFLEAVEIELSKQFTGNFAMATLKDFETPCTSYGLMLAT